MWMGYYSLLGIWLLIIKHRHIHPPSHDWHKSLWSFCRRETVLVPPLQPSFCRPLQPASSPPNPLWSEKVPVCKLLQDLLQDLTVSQAPRGRLPAVLTAWNLYAAPDVPLLWLNNCHKCLLSGDSDLELTDWLVLQVTVWKSTHYTTLWPPSWSKTPWLSNRIDGIHCTVPLLIFPLWLWIFSLSDLPQ